MRKIGKGFIQGGRKIAVQFDDDTFEEIEAIARKRQCSIASVIRELVEFGLMDIEP